MLISEEELLETHSKEMYIFLKSTVHFEKKVKIPKKLLLQPTFSEEISYFINNSDAVPESEKYAFKEIIQANHSDPDL